MGTFMVETYLSRDATGEPEATIARATLAAASIAAEGDQIRYLRAIFLPDDETCLLLFEAASSDVVRMLAQRARLDPDRVMPADLVDIVT
jgi:hypothetical protein